MTTRIHAAAFERDYRVYTSADVLPASIQPAAEWEWVDDPSSPNGGHSRRTGRSLTDDAGRVLFDVPAHVSTLDGRELRGARIRIRGLERLLPALQLLRPVGEVIVETNNVGRMTMICDTLEPITNAKHSGADHE